MPEADRHKEEERLKEVEAKFQQYMEKIKEARKKFGITGFKWKKNDENIFIKIWWFILFCFGTA